MHVLLVGATGVIGRATVPLLQRAGHRVRALRRDGRAFPQPVETVSGDLLDPDSLAHAVMGVDAVVNVASAVPTNPDPDVADWEPNDRLRDDGTKHLLAAIRAGGVDQYVHTSVALVYGLDRGGERLDEDAELRPPPMVESAVVGERRVAEAAAAGLRAVVLRPGWLYGPGSRHALDALQRLRAGMATVPNRATSWISPVAAADVARAVRVLLEDPAASGTYNVAGDALPVTELWTGVAARMGWPRPATDDAPVRSMRLSTQRLKDRGFAPTYADARDGLTVLSEHLGP